MLTLDVLALGLPPGYEARAERIARLVADALAHHDVSADLTLDRLAVPRVEVGPGTTDAQIAARVAAAIHAGILRAGERR